MSRRKGHNIKEMRDPIFVDNTIVTDWQKIRKKPENVNPTPQQEKFKEYGKKVKDECGSFRGDAKGMRSCQARIRDIVFGKKKKSHN